MQQGLHTAVFNIVVVGIAAERAICNFVSLNNNKKMGEKYYSILLDAFGRDRLRIRIETIKGGVEYFVVQYETLIDDK